jgi:hypothetical protein
MPKHFGVIGSLRKRWEDNIKTDVRGVGSEHVR